jgi:hypothetical protein
MHAEVSTKNLKGKKPPGRSRHRTTLKLIFG